VHRKEIFFDTTATQVVRVGVAAEVLFGTHRDVFSNCLAMSGRICRMVVFMGWVA